MRVVLGVEKQETMKRESRKMKVSEPGEVSVTTEEFFLGSLYSRTT